jgi:hypothetical protein
MFQIDAFETGKTLKAAGMKSAIEHEAEEWKRKYHLLAYFYIMKLASGTLFTGEQVRAVVEKQAGPPHHPNVWGAMFNGSIKKLIKAGDVQTTGSVIDATNSQAHRRAIRLYRRV